MDNSFFEGFSQAPAWVQIWVYWMMFINTAGLVFIRRTEGRIVFIVWILNATTMMLAAELNGYNRLLGLVHVIWWTPLLAYCWQRRKKIELSTLYGKWLAVLMATIATSLVMDAIDVIRYYLGDTT